MHLRPPSIDRGVTSFLWAFGFFLFLYFGMLAVDVSRANALIFSALAGCAIFLLVRLRPEDDIPYTRRARARKR